MKPKNCESRHWWKGGRHTPLGHQVVGEGGGVAGCQGLLQRLRRQGQLHRAFLQNMTGKHLKYVFNSQGST